MAATEPRTERPPAKLPHWRIPVRVKLVAILVLPLTLLVLLGASRVLDVREDAREARREAELAEVIVGPSGLLNALMNERNETSVYMLNLYDFYDIVEEGSYVWLRDETDAAAEEFLDLVEDDGEIQEIYQPAIDALDSLDEIRTSIDEIPESERTLDNIEGAQEYFETMATIIDPIFEGNAELRTMMSHEELERGVILIDRANRQLNTAILIIQDVSLLALVDQRGAGAAQEYFDIGGRYERLIAGDDEIRLYSDGDYEEYVDSLFSSEWHSSLFATLDEAIDTGTPDINGVFTIMDPDFADYMYEDLQIDAERTIVAEADEITREANRTRQLFLIASVLVLLLVGAVTTLVAMSITRPLLQLVEQATAMARDRLPKAVQSILETPPGEDVAVPSLAPVRVRTRDEVSDVADALTTVQESALDLAVEQAALRRNIADSYVNLGRRNQSLVGRQLDFITELEQKEADPEALANLFKLDHLATRMRRNAESLLVLAGIEPPRRWSAPVRLTDVVRASLGEVEDYQRVAVRGVEPATIVGSVAADLAHLLAELLENALTFSPPDRPVEIRGRFTPVQTAPPLGGTAEPGGGTGDIGDGSGGYTLAIVDSGLGMTTDDIERANRRLAGQESFTIAPSKYLGHYVAGMIAVRHGIQVQLHSSPDRGVTATLLLPAELLSSQAAAGPALATGTPPGGTAEPDTSLTPLGAGRSAGTPFGPRPAENMQPDLRGPGLASPAYRLADDAPLLPAGSQAIEAVGTQALEPAPPPAGSGGMTGAPATYRSGETEFSIDLGTSTAALPTETGSDRQQLIQRIQGAQMPRTQLPSLSREAAGRTGSRPGAPPTAPTPAATGNDDTGEGADEPVRDEARAGQVRNFLSSFSSGLEQGRDAAAREMGDPSEEN